MAQWYAAAGGQRYGPVDENTLRQWMQEGRIAATDLVWCEGMAQWAPAKDIPTLFPPAMGAEPPAPNAAVPPLPGQPSASGESIDALAAAAANATPQARRAMSPHRGAMVLVFGILSIFCCFIFGIAAWVMGNDDLNKMDQGVMDPAGRGMTSAGKICGIVGIILAAVGVLVGLLGGLGTTFHTHGF